MDAVSARGFAPRAVDKVDRLLDLMEEMGRHPDLAGKLAMHGGTAINLFMLDAPRLADDRPTLQGLMAAAERFVGARVLPRTDGEREYLDRFAVGDYRPGLLFPDEWMATAAERSPAALWKLQNLRRMKS